MMKLSLGLAIAYAIGFLCRWFDVPAPAPPMFQGAVMVVAMTLGYLSAGWVRGPAVPASVPAQVTPAAGDASEPGRTGGPGA